LPQSSISISKAVTFKLLQMI